MRRDVVVDTSTTRIFLARHGQTVLNAAGRLRGRLDPPLTPLGLRQAKALDYVLARANVGLIVASPLARAVQTAQAIANRAHLTIEVDERLIDRDYGRWAGSSLVDVEREWGSIDDAPGVEPLVQVRDRAMAAFMDVGDRSGVTAALIVSHDAINRPLLVALDPRLEGSAVAQETGCYNVIDRAGQGWHVVSTNNIPPLV
ncbi:MAG: histidine phosphatase family protein [Actinomycetota bacterium]|nr:histidine phosphatase family protein [Actinomycetota bacterium]